MAALDTADHNILFKKLSQSGIRGENKKDSHSGFFPQREHQRIKINNFRSNDIDVNIKEFNIPGGYLISWQ